jgi:hypothetical protein
MLTLESPTDTPSSYSGPDTFSSVPVTRLGHFTKVWGGGVHAVAPEVEETNPQDDRCCIWGGSSGWMGRWLDDGLTAGPMTIVEGL